MGYNPFRWYTKGKKKRLPINAHLFDKIKNGDFNYSHYYKEAESARKEYSSIFKKQWMRLVTIQWQELLPR